MSDIPNNLDIVTSGSYDIYKGKTAGKFTFAAATTREIGGFYQEDPRGGDRGKRANYFSNQSAPNGKRLTVNRLGSIICEICPSGPEKDSNGLAVCHWNEKRIFSLGLPDMLKLSAWIDDILTRSVYDGEITQWAEDNGGVWRVGVNLPHQFTKTDRTTGKTTEFLKTMQIVPGVKKGNRNYEGTAQMYMAQEQTVDGQKTELPKLMLPLSKEELHGFGLLIKQAIPASILWAQHASLQTLAVRQLEMF